jgi:hypothetical protein
MIAICRVAPDYEHLIKSVLDQAIIEYLLRYGRLVPGDDR